MTYENARQERQAHLAALQQIAAAHLNQNNNNNNNNNGGNGNGDGNQ